MTITATYHVPAVPARFASFGPWGEGEVHSCEVCFTTVQIRRSNKNGKRYVARVEARPGQWQGAYFRGIHTAQECQARFEADYDNRVAESKRLAEQQARASFTSRMDLVQRWLSIFKDSFEDITVRDAHCNAALDRWAFPKIEFVEATR